MVSIMKYEDCQYYMFIVNFTAILITSELLIISILSASLFLFAVQLSIIVIIKLFLFKLKILNIKGFIFLMATSNYYSFLFEIF